MVIRTHSLDLNLTLESAYQFDPPECCVLLNDLVVFQNIITETTTINYQTILPAAVHSLKICYHNKSNHDHLQAILIRSIEFNNIQDKKFVWLGRYQPVYPEPWATQQLQQGTVLESVLTNTDCLGWAGTWTLEFTSPIFTWIHQVKNLGTIYD